MLEIYRTPGIILRCVRRLGILGLRDLLVIDKKSFMLIICQRELE